MSKETTKQKTWAQAAAGKRVLFITTHRIDYIRNTQHIEELKKQGASVRCLYREVSGTGNHIFSAAKIFFTLLFTSLSDVDVVVVSYMCQLVTPFLNWKLKKKTLVVDFFVSLYDSMVNDRKMLGPKNPLARLIRWLDIHSVRYADRIIVDTKAHGDYFCQAFGMKRERMEVVYLNADTSIYYPRPQKKAPEFQGKFLVVYFGTVIPLQGFDIVLDAVRRLKDRKDIHFYLVGPVEKRYQKVESDTVTYADWVSQERLAEIIAMADLCLAGHFNGQIMKARRTIPGKAYIYEAMEKPMILGDSPANHERYQEGQPGIWFVPMGDAGKLAERIAKLAGVKEIDTAIDYGDRSGL